MYEPYAYVFDVTGTAFWIFRNFWDVTLTTNIIPGWERNYFELRTDGRPLSYPSNYIFQAEGSTDSRKKIFVRFGGIYATAPRYDNVYSGVSLVCGIVSAISFQVGFADRFSFEENQLGYAFMRETNGEPIVGFRNNRDFTSVLSGIYNFAYRLNLLLYGHGITGTG